MDTSQKPAAERGLDTARIAQDMQIRRVQVESVVQLLDEGNTVPFITRYRKERTGGLDEDYIRQIQHRVQHHRQLAERKQTILKSIESQGKLTDELRDAILAAETPQRLEDLYLPYKPKKRTLASTARDRGLEPFAQAIWARDPAVADLAATAAAMVNPEKELPTAEDVLLGAMHILAEQLAETTEVRAAVRAVLWETGKLVSTKLEAVPPDKGHEFRDYFEFSEPVRRIPPHRVLALNRGEKQHVLKVRFECDTVAARQVARDKLPLADHPHAEFLDRALDDGLTRLLLPSLERDIRRELADEAAEQGIKVFARNLRGLLLQRPIRAHRVLAIDPGFRTGCKLAALDETGQLLGHAVIYPHPPQKKRLEARLKLEELIRRHQTPIIVIGNGTGCRETEELIAEFIADLAQHGTTVPPPAPPAVNGQCATTENGPAPEAVLDTAPPVLEMAAPQAVLATKEYSVEPSSMPSLEAAPPAAPPPGEALAAATALPECAGPECDVAKPPAVATGEAIQLTAEPVPSIATPVSMPVPPPKPVRPPVPPVDFSTLPPPPADLAYVIVNEAGASIYSTSAVGKEEFPNQDATLRSTVSLGRRLQDPLAELVKVEPQHVGVGLYQHDMSVKWLRESLEGVVESCVNHVGVDLNTASVPLLRFVSGLNQHVAREVIAYRTQHGMFRNREQLLQVPGVGPARYVQAAGFLKILGQENPLDQTWVHPESYPAAQQLLADLGYGLDVLCDPERLAGLRAKLATLPLEETATRLTIGVPTLRDILDALARPGRDPREDLPEPVFKKGILKLEDLQPDMELKGTILNVVDFGAFVDVGLKDSGLIHISQLANRFIKNPHEVVTVGDVVTVWVKSVDKDRRRVSLTMIPPGTERKPPERRPAPQEGPPQGERGPQRGGPPRGRRQPPPGRRDARPARSPASQEAAPPAAAAASAARPAPPPRKPYREPPKPKLTKAALEGEAPLRTFSELMAFFEAQREKPHPSAPAKDAEGETTVSS